MTVRLRVQDKLAWLTLKGPASEGSRVECEYPIPVADAHQMLALPGVISLSKTRYLVEHKGHTFEVDEYHGPLTGLYTAECELASIFESVALPDWIGGEVKGQRAWDNDSLAREGLPPNYKE